MASTIKFEEMFSKFLLRIEGYDLFKPGITEEMRIKIISEYFKSAISPSYVRRLFNVIWVSEPSYLKDDENEDGYMVDGLIEFSMKRPTNDEKADRDFVLDVCSLGMAIAWVEPKVNSATSLLQFVGTADEKFYSQSNHLKELSALKENLEIQLRGLIRDRGFIYNDYLDGKSKTSELRG